MTDASNRPTDGPAFTDLPPRVQYDILAADRRQLMLDLLGGKTTTIPLEELAAGVAAREDGADTDDATVQRVASSLHHCHLTRLAESGIVDYDSESHQIDPAGAVQAPPADQTRDWLAAISDPLRRLVLEHLSTREQTTLEELATALAEGDDPAVDPHPATIGIQLHHHHLPRLDELGYVDYDPVDRVVESTERLTRTKLSIGTS